MPGIARFYEPGKAVLKCEEIPCFSWLPLADREGHLICLRLWRDLNLRERRRVRIAEPLR